jgi:hypothetical protein
MQPKTLEHADIFGDPDYYPRLWIAVVQSAASDDDRGPPKVIVLGTIMLERLMSRLHHQKSQMIKFSLMEALLKSDAILSQLTNPEVVGNACLGDDSSWENDKCTNREKRALTLATLVYANVVQFLSLT